MADYWEKDPDKEEKKPKSMWDDFTTYHPQSTRTSHDSNIPGSMDYLKRVEAKIDRDADPAADASLTARTTWLLNEGLQRSGGRWSPNVAQDYWGAGFWGPTSENYHAVHPKVQADAVRRSQQGLGSDILSMLGSVFSRGGPQ